MRLHDFASAALIAALSVCAPSCAHAADEALYRQEAPLTVDRGAPFVELALPADAYARSRRPLGADAAIADLRIVDSRGERVPFAWLPRRSADSATREEARDTKPYALPARPAADGTWRAPIDVVVEGDRIQVRRLGSTTTGANVPAGVGSGAGAAPGGWVFDLGERLANVAPGGRAERPERPERPEQLRLVWSGPAEFSAAFDLATSDDLRTWRAAGSGQVLALQPGTASASSAASRALTQPDIALPGNTGRFVRLVWADASTAPRITGAQAITVQRDRVVRDAPAELSFVPAPANAIGGAPSSAPGIAPGSAPPTRAVEFDLGAALPLVDIALQWTTGTHVAPVRVMTRVRSEDAWRDAGSAVFYRLDRQGTVSTSPDWAWHGSARYLRFEPDERAAALDAAQLRLRVHAELARLVFASQGAAPYRLQVGSTAAAALGNRPAPAEPATALPIGSLVPALDDERAKFGAASVGAWSEIVEAARRDDANQRQAALRPWLLWAVMIGGVALLAFMVWRLAASAKKT